MSKFGFSPGAGLIGIDPQKVGEEVTSLQTTTPKRLVDFARGRPESEVHKAFTWDDQQAGYRYRLQEARNLLENLVVVESKPSQGWGQAETIKVSVRAMEARLVEGVEVYVKADTAKATSSHVRGIRGQTPSAPKMSPSQALSKALALVSEAKLLLITNHAQVSHEALEYLVKVQEELESVKAE